MDIGSAVGRQPQTVSDPNSPRHETCWIWKPTQATEDWILYRGPAADFPYVDPSAAEPDVWLEIECVGGPGFFTNVPEFIAWVLNRLLTQGRRNLPTDLELRTHPLV